MRAPPTPPDERRRLDALRALQLLDTQPEERFDRFTRLAQRLFGVPIALVSLIDRDRQWFKSRQGLAATETSREASFCGHAILGAETLVVEDAKADERFSDNPLVDGDPNIRFYAGRPIAGPTGARLGTVCIIDRAPRAFTKDDEQLLDDLAAMVESEISALAMATTDDLTGLANRRGFELCAKHSLAVSRRQARALALLFIDLDGFKATNDIHGHAVGDQILQEFSSILLDVFRESDVIARMGGDEFAVLLTGTTALEADVPVARLKRTLAERNEAPGSGPSIACSVGLVEHSAEVHPDLDALLEASDQKMYEDKKRR